MLATEERTEGGGAVTEPTQAAFAMDRSSENPENGETEPLVDEETKGKGGIRAIPPILGIEAVEQITSYGLPPNMILYLTKDYHLEVVKGSTILYFWNAAISFFPVVGAFIADSYLGRFTTIACGSIFSLLGLFTLWMTSLVPGAHPPQCSTQDSSCSAATGFQLFILCAGFALVSIGTGGIRSSSLAFGADQLKKREGQKSSRALAYYFSLYYGLAALSIFIALCGIVYVQDKMGWKVGFGIPAILMVIAAISFLVASPFYIKSKVKTNLIVGLVQVVVASFKRRHIKFPKESTDTMFHCRKDSDMIQPSENLRCLNKACLIIDSEKELTTDGTAKDPWSLCTVDQVEELKMLIRVMPLWSTGVLLFVCINQTSITVLQAKTMDRKFGFLTIPAGSFGTFQIFGVVLWVVLFYFVILRVASKVMGRPVVISSKQKMGLGVVTSFLAMVAAATVETVRRRRAISAGAADKPNAEIDMSAFWLLPQVSLIGVAEAFSAISQNEFYYSEFPRSMSSIAASMLLLGISISNLIATLIMNIINDITSNGGKQSWISSNINQGHYDYYYWVLSVIALANVFYFRVSSKLYGPSKDEKNGLPMDWGDVYPRL